MAIDKIHVVSIRFSDQDMSDISRISKNGGVSKADLIRMFVRDGLSSYNGQNLSEIQSQNESILNAVESLKQLVSTSIAASISLKVERYRKDVHQDGVFVKTNLDEANVLGERVLQYTNKGE